MAVHVANTSKGTCEVTITGKKGLSVTFVASNTHVSNEKAAALKAQVEKVLGL